MLRRLLDAKAMLCVPGCCEVYMAAVAYSPDPQKEPCGNTTRSMQFTGDAGVSRGASCLGVSEIGAAGTVELLHIVPVSRLPRRHHAQDAAAVTSKFAALGGDEDCDVAARIHASDPQCMRLEGEEGAAALECRNAPRTGPDSRSHGEKVDGLLKCMHWMHECAAEFLGEFAFGASGVARSDSPAGMLREVDSAAQQSKLEKLGWTVLVG